MVDFEQGKHKRQNKMLSFGQRFSKHVVQFDIDSIPGKPNVDMLTWMWSWLPWRVGVQLGWPSAHYTCSVCVWPRFTQSHPCTHADPMAQWPWNPPCFSTHGSISGDTRRAESVVEIVESVLQPLCTYWANRKDFGQNQNVVPGPSVGCHIQ